MPISQDKRALIVNLGGDPPAPTHYFWQVVTFVRDDQGHDVVPPQPSSIETTADEAAAYLNAALIAQRDQMAKQAGDAAAQVQTLTTANETLTQQFTTLKAKYDELSAAHAQLQSEIEPV